MRFTLTLGTALVVFGCAAGMLPASVTITDRSDLVVSSAQAQRYPPLGSDPIASDDIYSVFDNYNGILPSPHTVTTTGSGSMNDTATNLALVASGSGSINATSSLGYDGSSNLNLYVVTGNYTSTIHSATLAGYLPDNVDPNTDPYATGGGVYNSAISFVVSDVPTAFSIDLTQANTVGANVYNAAMLYKDANNDGNFIPADGDEMIDDSLLVVGDGEQTSTGVLQPSASPYRLLFYGNSYDGTFDDNQTLTSSTNYSSTFSLSFVPEPGSIAGVGLLGLAALRRTRRLSNRR